MSGNAFGGKKAAPFKRGGGRVQTVKGKDGKMRPGSITSGSGKGKFPITGQKSVKSAAHLIGHAKGVSQKKVAQHIVAAAKARGLTVPASVKAKAS